EEDLTIEAVFYTSDTPPEDEVPTLAETAAPSPGECSSPHTPLSCEKCASHDKLFQNMASELANMRADFQNSYELVQRAMPLVDGMETAEKKLHATLTRLNRELSQAREDNIRLANELVDAKAAAVAPGLNDFGKRPHTD